jgi:hypothetical protein
MSSCTGNRNTAPEMPTGAVTIEMPSPAPNPIKMCAQFIGHRSPQQHHVS